MNQIGWLLRLAPGVAFLGFLKAFGHSPLNLLLLAAVLVLEWRRTTLSANVALLLGVALGGVVGREVALAATAVTLLFRQVRRQGRRRVWEGLGEGAALGLCLGFLPQQPGPLAWVAVPLAYCLLHQILTSLQSLTLDPFAREGHRSLWSVHLVVAVSATVVAVLSRWQPFAWLLLVPVLALLQELVQERLSLNRARRELSLLEKLTRDSASIPSAGQCLQLALRVLTSSFTCQSAVLYYSPEQDLSTLRSQAYQTPFSQRLESGDRLEPLVERAFRLGEPVLYTAELTGARVFEGEEVAAAFPLGGLGVLYVGRKEGPLRLEEHQFLVAFAQRVSFALLLGQQRQAKERDLHLEREAKAALTREVGWLASLLEGSRKFSASLRSHELLSELQRLLQASLPHDAGEVWLDPSGPAHSWGSSPVGRAREILSSVVTSGQPLIANSDGSVLCVPIASESQVHGGILLGARRPQAFSPDQKQFLWALAYSLGAALTNARLFSDLEKYQVQLVNASKLNAIGEIAAGVAHEINSPLGAVVMSLELVQSQLPPDQAKSSERLSRALHALAQAREIVSKLMVYSRPSASPVESVALAELVSDAYRLFGATWSDSGVEVLLEVPSQLRARCKRVEMHQVIVHLVKNASRACLGLPKERAKVRVSARVADSEVALEVVDSGCGIAAEELQKIFEPFVTGSTPGQGGGLGLALCRELVASTQGRLVAQSKVGQGSCFSVFLARAVEESSST